MKFFISFAMMILISSNISISASDNEIALSKILLTPISCTVAAAHTISSFVLELAPGVSLIGALPTVFAELTLDNYVTFYANDGYFGVSSRNGNGADHELATVTASLAGGAVSLVFDFVSMTIDIVDGKIIDNSENELYDMPFMFFRHSFGATEAAIDHYYKDQNVLCAQWISYLESKVD